MNRRSEDQARLRCEYISTGGDPSDFAAFWSVRGPELIVERMREQERNIAHPRDYMNGNIGGARFSPHEPNL
jgi:hypothetical protein